MTRGSAEDRRWTVATVWLPAAVLLTITVPALLLAGRLPDPVAAHWSRGGPDGSVPLRSGLAGAALIWAVCWASVAGLGASTVRRLGFLLPTVMFVGGVLGATTVVVLVLNLDASAWESARAPGRIAMYSPLAAGVAMAGFGFVLQGHSRHQGERASNGGGPAAAQGRTRAGPRGARSSRVAALRLSRGDRVVWVRRVRQRPTWVPIGLAALTALGIAGTHHLAWVAALAFVGTGILLQATVWIDRRGVRVGLGPWGWPARRIALEDVRSVSVVDVDPADYGGWGYRLWRSGTDAIVLRRGEALRVEAASGRVLVVTVKGAPEAAAVLAGLRAAREHYSS